MTEALYLSRIALAQFRNFEKLDIELAPQPGVFVVHGSNGLGKSSLFDALEWTLTGEIDHFKGAKGVKKVGSYLCRWRKGDPGSTTAAMTFSDGSVVERSLKSAKATKSAMSGTVQDVISFLRSPDWKRSITSLERYLLLTHFLGQSTTSRLTHRNADERFDMLKEAAQSDWIEAIADTLHGRGNTTASRAFTRRIDLLTREATIIRDLLDQEAELWDGAQASGALDEAQGIALATQVVDLLGEFSPNRDAASTWTPSASGATIEEMRSRLDQARRSLDRTMSSLDRARQIVEEAQRHRKTAVGASAELTDIEGEQRVIAHPNTASASRHRTPSLGFEVPEKVSSQTDQFPGSGSHR